MTEQFQAWAAFEPKGQISPWSYAPRALGPRDIEIKISHCGVCASDLHKIDSGWGPSKYPLVPGHEIIGHVTQIGSEVSRFKIGTCPSQPYISKHTYHEGQRVGVGPLCHSCHACQDCQEHLESYCDKKVATYGGAHYDGATTYGGYAEQIRVDERFTFAIPENLSSEEAAPLLCAGVTMYSPLKHFGAGPGVKVGIVGIGGLGHLGLKFARAMGAEVYAISTSSSKQQEAITLGAHHFINTKIKEDLQKFKKSMDLIICTLDGDVDWSMYANLVKRDGKFVLVGIPETKLQIPAFSLIMRFAGSFVGSPSETEEMLQVASKNKIGSNVQVWPIEQVNEAIENFRKGNPRYRYVLQLSKL